jgi:hypothetical protein
MSAIHHHPWGETVINKVPTRDEIIEDKLRHIISRLERMEKVGKKDYLQLDPVEATALAIVLKDRVADYTIKRYATDREQEQIEMTRQAKIVMQQAARAQALPAGLAVGLSGGGGVTKKSWWKP